MGKTLFSPERKETLLNLVIDSELTFSYEKSTLEAEMKDQG